VTWFVTLVQLSTETQTNNPSGALAWIAIIIPALLTLLKAFSEHGKTAIERRRADTTMWESFADKSNDLRDDLIVRLNEADERYRALEARYDSAIADLKSFTKKHNDLLAIHAKMSGRLEIYEACPKSECPYRGRFALKPSDV